MRIEQVPDDALLCVMEGRRSLFRRNRRAAIAACREMIRRREVALGWRREDIGEALSAYWREDNARTDDYQVFV